MREDEGGGRRRKEESSSLRTTQKNRWVLRRRAEGWRDGGIEGCSDGGLAAEEGFCVPGTFRLISLLFIFLFITHSLLFSLCL